MANFDALLERNAAFAVTKAHIGLELPPRHRVFILACMDARVDPALLLNMDAGDALVLRNAGGRVNREAIQEVAFLGTVSEKMSGGDPPEFEVAVIHHTECGSRLFTDEGFRTKFAKRIGVEPDTLLDQAVVNPEATVRADVELLRTSSLLPGHVTVSGHVYDVTTGLIETVVTVDAPRKG